MQIIVNGLISGLTIALLALAFSIVYLPTRVFHVALGGVYASIPFIAWACLQWGWPWYLAVTVATFVMLSTFYCWLRLSNLGLQFRALADNPIEFALRGYNVRRLRLVAFGISGVLCSGSALLVSYDIGFDPHGGLVALLLAVVAVIIGGRESFMGPVMGGIFLGLVRSEGYWRNLCAGPIHRHSRVFRDILAAPLADNPIRFALCGFNVDAFLLGRMSNLSGNFAASSSTIQYFASYKKINLAQKVSNLLS